ncbi:hypothetical protein Aazo_3375 ['Nostoc azollae' 0708]|jgi:hypothetical protein|uniref:Uncharacterized protein n=1 Tax=Nostoc azollae (strain 0708) TaxID=551115 RepID=D7E2W3_NOSA0|nr:hypothetical protein Aazo_3375 ['Nostoc azollae' 0708]
MLVTVKGAECGFESLMKRKALLTNEIKQGFFIQNLSVIKH